MKLQIKHLAPYLPYGLKVKNGNDVFTINALSLECVFFKGGLLNIFDAKPILRPLSDLTEEHNKEIHLRSPNAPNWQYFYKEWISENEDLSETIIEYSVLEYLFEWNFDVFGLIENGLAIDINSINNQ